MPISFEQPGAYDAGVGESYGALEQENKNRDFALRLAIARANSGTQIGGGGGYPGVGRGGHGDEVSARDEWLAQQAMARDQQHYGQQLGLQREHVNNQMQMQEFQMTLGERMELAKLNQQLSAIDNNDSLTEQDKQIAKLEVQARINPLAIKAQRFQTQQMEQQNQRFMQQHALQTAAESQGQDAILALQSRNWERDHVRQDASGRRFTVGRNGVPTGHYFDPVTGALRDPTWRDAQAERQATARESRNRAAESRQKFLLDIVKHVYENEGIQDKDAEIEKRMASFDRAVNPQARVSPVEARRVNPPWAEGGDMTPSQSQAMEQFAKLRSRSYRLYPGAADAMAPNQQRHLREIGTRIDEARNIIRANGSYDGIRDKAVKERYDKLTKEIDDLMLQGPQEPRNISPFWNRVLDTPPTM